MANQIQDELAGGILALFENNKNARLLDLGCFDGEFTAKIAERTGSVKTAGVDFDIKVLQKAKARGIEVYHADLSKGLPFENEGFDVVHAKDVIEHLADTDTFVEEIYRVLKPGGYTVVGTPNLAALPSIMYLAFGLQPFEASVSDKAVIGSWHPTHLSASSASPIYPIPAGMGGHRRLFTLRALKGLFEYYGFEVEKAIGCGYYPLPAILGRFMCLVDKKHSVYIAIKARRRV